MNIKVAAFIVSEKSINTFEAAIITVRYCTNTGLNENSKNTFNILKILTNKRDTFQTNFIKINSSATTEHRSTR